MGLKKCKECGQEVSTKAKACPKCGTPSPTSMSMFKKICIGLGMLFVLALVGGRKGANNTTATAEPQSKAAVASAAAPAPEPELPPMDITALKLWTAYDTNEVAADEALKGKRLLVSGAVASIDKDFTDSIIVALQATNPFMSVHAYVNDDQKARAAGLRKGQSVKVLCTCDGRIMGSPVLKQCVIQ